MSTDHSHKVKALILLVDGFEEIEAVTIIDVLRRGGVEVTLAHLGASNAVHGAPGLVMRAARAFKAAAADKYDAIVLPGGPGTKQLVDSEALHHRLRRQRDEGGLLCAICAAPVALVAAGVVEPGLHLTCYPSCAGELDRECAGVPVVADGNVITGQAPGAAMLFALVVLSRLRGENAAAEVAAGMVTDVL